MRGNGGSGGRNQIQTHQWRRRRRSSIGVGEDEAERQLEDRRGCGQAEEALRRLSTEGGRMRPERKMGWALKVSGPAKVNEPSPRYYR
ncbi:hypothetical protein CRG98_049411 [Punica granatum]|uniref:Uncharacterized protein n=1 Tax=Punica granatum TaxID=22663 RepID=A0A2I0HET1_PUNGR|nr:hypothetical protein CRG98_049411 [Punica granatum]